MTLGKTQQDYNMRSQIGVQPVLSTGCHSTDNEPSKKEENHVCCPTVTGEQIRSAERDRKVSICDNTDVYKLYTDTELYKAMKPLFICLQIVGLHYVKNYGTVTECMQRRRCHKNHNSVDKSRNKVSGSQVYSYGVFSMVENTVEY